MYTQNNHGVFPFVEGADASNTQFYLLFPNYMTTTRPFVCPSESDCRRYAPQMTRAEFDKPNVSSYAYVAGLTQTTTSDSPLAGDNLINPRAANDLTVAQYGKRTGCAQGGGNHKQDGSNVVFADGHGEFNSGTKLRIRWADGEGGTKNIKNPKGIP